MQTPSEPNKILIVKLGALGDVIMAEGCMRCVRQHYPDAHITLITEPLYARFMEVSPHLDAVLPYKRLSRWNFAHLWATKKTLLAQGFDLVIDMQNSSHSRRFQKWLDPAFISSTSSRASARYNRDASRRLASRDYLAEQLASIGVDVSVGYLSDITWAVHDVAPILQKAGVSDGFAFLIPGSAARHPLKRWPHYHQLAEALTARGISSVTAPGPDEIDLCRDLPAQMLMDGDRPLTFNQLIGLGQHCRFIVGNDSGPTHLMAAAATKGVALFGGHSPASNTGIDKVYQVLEKPDLETITVDDVMMRIDTLMTSD